MARQKKKTEHQIFDSIRKPTAPPTRKIGTQKPETRVHPAKRKTKHKKKAELSEA